MRRRFVLDDDQFRELVAGRAVVLPGAPPIELILSDLGWARLMHGILNGIASGLAPVIAADPPQAREFLPNHFTRERRTRYAR
jgi:hypothetical protein